MLGGLHSGALWRLPHRGGGGGGGGLLWYVPRGYLLGSMIRWADFAPGRWAVFDLGV